MQENPIINDNYVLNELKNYKYWSNKIPIDVFEYCKTRFKDIQPYTNKISEFIYRLENGIKESPRCPVCGKKLPFLTYKEGYRKLCSRNCQFSKTGKAMYQSSMHLHFKEKYGNIDIENLIKEHQKNDLTDDDIKQLFLKDDGKINAVKLNIKYLLRNNYYDVISYLFSKYAGYDITKSGVISEIVYRIINNVNEIPKCEICGSSLQYINYAIGYGKYCKNCRNDRKKLAAYLLPKSRKTYKEKTGYENPYSNPEVKQQIKNTWKANGYDHPMQCQGIKNHIANTMIARYGIKTVLALNDIKDKAHSQEAINKCDRTKRLNNSYSSSKIEDQIYKQLIKQFGDGIVKRNYKSPQ